MEFSRTGSCLKFVDSTDSFKVQKEICKKKSATENACNSPQLILSFGNRKMIWHTLKILEQMLQDF